MAWSAQSRSEWIRRTNEQIQLGRDNVAKLSRCLETGDFSMYRHYKMIVVKGKEKLGPLMTDEEMRVWCERKLVEAKEHVAQWSKPIDFGDSKPKPVKVPKAVRIAMQRVRKRTRAMLERKARGED